MGRLGRVGLVLAALVATSGGDVVAAPASRASAASETAPPEAAQGTPGEAVAGGRAWRLETASGSVYVWIPRGYDPAVAATVVYLHGYFIDVDGAWREHRLPEQFAASGLDAMFIACDTPADAAAPIVWPSLHELLRTVRRALGRRVPRGRVIAFGHSGAHRTLSSWLDARALDTIVMLDAAYTELPPYRAWLRASRHHRLIDVGDDTRWRTDRFHRSLPETRVVQGFPAPEAGVVAPGASRARVLYVRSSVGHMELVTEGWVIPMVLRALRAPMVRGHRRASPLAPLATDAAPVTADRGQSDASL